MSAAKIALLGAIAGFTIYLGLPIGRLRSPGILIFLLWDVLAHAWEPVDGALSAHHYGPVAGNGIVLAIGLGVGLVATEGFGIVAPMAAAGTRPSWGRLALLGLIGGGPTFVGTLLGQHLVNDTLSIAFLALAGGSILYVVIELLAVGRRLALKTVTTWGIFLGVTTGFLTDAIVTAAGA